MTTLFINSCKTKEAQPQVQLLQNGDLEQNPSQKWTFGYYYNLTSNPNKYKGEYSTEAAASGTHALKITCDTIRNDTTFCYFSQSITPVNIVTGAKLTLKAKVKTINLQGKGLSITLIGYKTNSIRNTVVFVPSTLIPAKGTSDFNEYSLVLDKYPGGVDIIVAYLFYEAKTTGTAYFDDIFLSVD